MRTVDRVCAILDSIGVKYALIGARALGARGYPRTTVDYDLFTLDPRVLVPALWSER